MAYIRKSHKLALIRSVATRMTSRCGDSEGQVESAAARLSCRCRSGRADRGGRSCGCGSKAAERTPDQSIPIAQRRRARHGHCFAPQPADRRLDLKAGSCARRCRAARRDARRPPESSASSRKSRSITRTCMTTPSCRTCNASPGPASRSMAASCRGARRRMAVSGCRSISPSACSTRPAMGMRVIVAPSDVAPVGFAHPLLFQPRPGAAAQAASRAVEAQEATRKAAEARAAAGTALREATQARVPVRAAENLKRGSRGAAGCCRDQAWLWHFGGGKGAG